MQKRRSILGGERMEKNYRHEYKFLISKSAAELLRLRLPHFMRRDSHAGPTGRYTIRSLYFDDANYNAYYEKTEGVDNRTKYRIRLYDYDASYLRLECKEKKGSLTRKTGQTISLRGQGHAGLNGGPKGDLKVGVFVRPHPHFERDGFNVWYEQKVSFTQAALGDSIQIPTIDGDVKFDLPAGTQSESVFVLKGRGIQILNGRGKGDQLVKIIVEDDFAVLGDLEVPRDLTPRQRELMLELEKEMGVERGAAPSSKKSGFFDKFKNQK